MCRIFGLLDPRLSREELHRRGDELAQLLDHGGPDGRSHRVFDGILAGGTRLAISDPESGWQPFTAEGFTVFYNGEIYNAPELRRGLVATGVEFRTRCDGEVLAPLFARHGAAAARLLDGMFAIMAYEHRTRRLTLVRDQSGLKPLYLFSEGGRLGFASEIPALLRLRGGGIRLDPDALDRYLRFKAVYGAVPEPGALGDPTLIEGIRSLPPGHALEVVPGGVPAVMAVASVAPEELSDPVEDLAGRLPGLVAEMLPTDVPYCAVLSGGLDSSVITTLAARAAGPLQAFTVVPKHPSAYDELPFAQLVAKTTGSRLEQVTIGGSDLPGLLPAVVRNLGQPNSDPIIVSTYRLFEAVRAAGYPVALTGDASDELFGGYDRFRALARSGDTGAYRDALSGVPAMWREALYTKDARQALHEHRRPDDGPWARPRPSKVTPAEDATGFELRHRLPVYHLQRLDHLSAAHSVEARVPFCRNGITSLGRSLGLADKLGPGNSVKRTLSTAATRHRWAPEVIVNRPKQPFTFRLSDNLLEDQGTALDWARQVLTDPSAQRGSFEGAQVEKVLAQFDERPSEPLAHTVWALLVLELWLREITGGRS
ncbi:asparagine synthase (glutamine-hydrolyzing) [Actinacidiphila oryziradicis]|uniref:asparagine synthase (glutamine-hydrolyzing) n=1 Tax=Actinacidiphila oryziradicis TaxID=2571141 RepID=A0A4U0S1E8_9ACTN|nr:asparagine synthase (glutamine-hydrolyzing) [Actinacidiphila oryziradicis]TKA01928.1 asparagine synthase (glutamine-hydrolyzing) [Actinacidiphila oryziradicis]